MSSRSRFVPALSAVAIAALAVTGCSSGKTVADTGPTQSISATANADLSAQLPASIKSKGELVMATDPSYAPIEFSKSSGGYQGFDVDLANAIGTVLKTKVVIRKAQFDGILTGLNAGRYDFSMSAFTDNTEREKGNDFVTYFKAGTSIGVKKGNPKKIESQDDLCGLKVGAEKGTIQATALTDTMADGAITLKGQCLKEGKTAPVPVLLPNQGDVNTAVVSGRADAFTGDTPVVVYQGTLEGGQIELAGKTTDEAPYGIAFKKNSALVAVFQKAVTELIKNGTYTKIVAKWKLQTGAITESKINDAS